MDALVPAFIVALLAEIGDATQLLAMLLGARFRSPAPVIAGIALAALANMGLGAAAGYELGDVVNHRAIQLMTGLALLLAGGGALFRAKAPDPVDGWKLGAFASSAGAFFILSLFDKTQFVVAALAAGSGGPVLAAIGAAAGVTVANAPAVVLADRWPAMVPLVALRRVAGLLLALAGLYVGFAALGILERPVARRSIALIG
jgi:putative Ca2+/H+ antiporter (TMEM165/GDT1 family)